MKTGTGYTDCDVQPHGGESFSRWWRTLCWWRISRHVCILQVHDHVYNSRPLCPIMSHMIPIHQSGELLLALDSTVILGFKSRRSHVNILVFHSSESRATSPTHSVSLRSTSASSPPPHVGSLTSPKWSLICTASRANFSMYFSIFLAH
jgi:hypothetical protein